MLNIATDSAYQVKLMRTVVGLEAGLVKQFAKKPETHHFKVLGNYDVLEICKLQKLSDAIRGASDFSILNINSFPCFPFNAHITRFSESLASAVSPTLILLKLHNATFRRRGLKGVYRVAQFLEESSPGIIPLIGLGYYEILIWYPSNDLSNVFDFLNFARKLIIFVVLNYFSKIHRDSSLLIDSNSIPTISYKNVILPKQWDKLNGSISPLLKIKCAPGHESRISYLLDKGCHQYLGADDLLCKWDDPIEVKAFISFLLAFREKVKNSSVLDTVTKFYNPNCYEITDIPVAELPKSDIISTRLRENLKSTEHIDNIDQFILSELSNVVSIFNLHSGSGLLSDDNYEIKYTIIYYLNELIKSYIEAARENNHGRIYSYESMLLQLTGCIRTAFAQQFSSKGYAEYHDVNYQPVFACSLSIIIKAISLIPEQLFKLISLTPSPPKLETLAKAANADKGIVDTYKEYSMPWKGFMILDMTEGYSIINESELIIAPYKDIFNTLNWITLSHEVSHGYFTRIEFNFIEDDYINRIWGQNIKKYPPEKVAVYEDNIKESLFEFFAHWFDFKHFFNGEFEFYLWSIWRTYLEIPRVYLCKNDYWTRSLFIRLCHLYPTLKPKITDLLRVNPKTEDRHRLLQEIFYAELNETINFLKSKFGTKLTELEPTEADKMYISKNMISIFDLARLFEEKYVVNDLVNAVNRSYPGLEKDITDIFSGNVVMRKIENPYLLLREILKKSFTDATSNKPSVEVSVAMIYSLWQTSRYYKR